MVFIFKTVVFASRVGSGAFVAPPQDEKSIRPKDPAAEVGGRCRSQRAQ